MKVLIYFLIITTETARKKKMKNKATKRIDLDGLLHAGGSQRFLRKLRTRKTTYDSII